MLTCQSLSRGHCYGGTGQVCDSALATDALSELNGAFSGPHPLPAMESERVGR